MTRIGIVVGTTRPGRLGIEIAHWVEKTAKERGDAEFELVDLADYALPLFDEPTVPRLGSYRNDHTRAWSAKIDELDGFVFVTPEYNWSIPAALKNAIDFIYREWNNKAAGIVGYGSNVRGARAIDHLRLIAGAVQMSTVYTQSICPWWPTSRISLPSPRPNSTRACCGRCSPKWSASAKRSHRCAGPDLVADRVRQGACRTPASSSAAA